MKKLIVPFFILTAVFIVAYVVFEYYVEVVPVFSVLLLPLMLLGIAAGVFMAVCVVVEIVKEIKHHKGD